MTSKEIRDHFADATSKVRTGTGHYVTRDMMEKESIGRLIEKTSVKPDRIILSVGERHILRRKI